MRLARGVFMWANTGGLSNIGRSRIHRGVQVNDVHAEANLKNLVTILLDLEWETVRYPILTAYSLARALF